MSGLIRYHIEGVPAVRAAIEKVERAITPAAGFGAGIRAASLEAATQARPRTPVQTGALQSSHTPRVQGLRGEVYLNPAVVNPRNRTRPADYGPGVHKRKPFYQRTVTEAGQAIARAAFVQVEKGLPR